MSVFINLYLYINLFQKHRNMHRVTVFVRGMLRTLLQCWQAGYRMQLNRTRTGRCSFSKAAKSSLASENSPSSMPAKEDLLRHGIVATGHQAA